MNTKAFLFVLWLLPSFAWAQGTPAWMDEQKLLQFYMQSFLQQPILGPGNEFNLFRDGTVLHGTLILGGTSTTTTTNPIGLAQTIGANVRTQFAIPADYQWVVAQGGLSEQKPITMIGSSKIVDLLLAIDGVPLDRAYIEVMVDGQGRTQKIAISIPRLRPEIVAAVRGTTITAAQAQAAIRADANQLPDDGTWMINEFMIKPNTDLEYIDLKKVARAQAPYIVYTCIVNAGVYVVDAKTGAIVERISRMKDMEGRPKK